MVFEVQESISLREGDACGLRVCIRNRIAKGAKALVNLNLGSFPT